MTNLFGASGHGKVIFDILQAEGKNVGVFFDDNPHCEFIGSLRVLSTKESPVSGRLIISIGNNKIRRSISERFNALEFDTAIHPDSIISPSAEIGKGTVVMAGAIIQAEAVIGKHCIINTGASIDHECQIGDFSHVSPHATLCGNVSIGEGTWIGAGAVVSPGIKIGKWAIVGAGAVVISDVADNTTVVGVPAKEISVSV